jgi:hypothetical protein
MGAQGMNTGLQDAYNLAWKLALVTEGQAGAALLDSYEAERMPVARRLLATTDRAFRLVVSDNPLAGIFRTKILARIAAFAMRRERIQYFAFRTISQTGISYRDSPLSQAVASAPEGAPVAGDRMPWLHLKFRADGPVEDTFARLDDTHYYLLLFGQSLDAGGVTGLGLGDLLRVHVVPADPANDRELARARIPQPSFYLLRPDGHVGLAGALLDTGAVTSYVAEQLHVGAGHR